MSRPVGNEYHYTACGLDDVFLVNFPEDVDRAGDRTITIRPNLLHAFLQKEVALKEAPLNGKEIRFLRTRLGLTQAELARVLHKDGQTVGRWERGETLIDGTSETLLRAMALEGCDTDGLTIKDLALRIGSGTGHESYRVEASNPANYRRAA